MLAENGALIYSEPDAERRRYGKPSAASAFRDREFTWDNPAIISRACMLALSRCESDDEGRQIPITDYRE
jgi:hypothetical protein